MGGGRVVGDRRRRRCRRGAECAGDLLRGAAQAGRLGQLYFGRGKPDGGEVSDAEWEDFLGTVVTQRFPDGLSVNDITGQYRGPSGRIVSERSKRLHIVVFDAPAHLPLIEEIIAIYRHRFRQDAVMRTERSLCAGL